MNFVFFTYLPPAIEKSGVYKKVVEFVSDGETGHALSSDDQIVDYMENIVTDVIDVLGQETHMQRLTLIPENNEDGQYGLYGNDELLMLLNYMVNGHWHPVFLTPTNKIGRAHV